MTEITEESLELHARLLAERGCPLGAGVLREEIVQRRTVEAKAKVREELREKLETALMNRLLEARAKTYEKHGNYEMPSEVEHLTPNGVLGFRSGIRAVLEELECLLDITIDPADFWWQPRVFSIVEDIPLGVQAAGYGNGPIYTGGEIDHPERTRSEGPFVEILRKADPF